MMVTMANFTPGDRDANKRTSSVGSKTARVVSNENVFNLCNVLLYLCYQLTVISFN